VAASNATGGWAFRGKVIVQTLVEHLLTVQGMTQAKQVLLTGFSAGGFGVLNNADFVGQLVQKGAQAATYKAYADSTWDQDVPTFNPGDQDSRYTVQELHTNFHAIFDDSCEAVYAAAGEQWRCLFGVYVYPFISTPLFVAGYQYDMPFLGDVGPPFTNATGAYAAVLKDGFLMQTRPLNAFFSPNCYCHGVESYDARWNYITVNGTTASTAVWNFLNGQPSRNVDTCTTIGCNPTCSCVFNPKTL